MTNLFNWTFPGLFFSLPMTGFGLPLVSEATALPTVSQPLPSSFIFWPIFVFGQNFEGLERRGEGVKPDRLADVCSDLS